MLQLNQDLIERHAVSFDPHGKMVLLGLAWYQPQMSTNHRVPVWELSLVLGMVSLGV